MAYEEAFEGAAYTNGYDMIGAAGWYGVAGGAVVNTNSDILAALITYTNTVGRLPIPTNHKKVVEITGIGPVTNLVDAGEVGGTERVFTDFMLMPTHSGSEPSGAGENLSLYVNPSSNLVVWHNDAVNGPEWLELTNSPSLATGVWARITMEQNYAGYRYQIRVNEATNDFIADGSGYTSPTNGSQPGTWFNMVQSNGTSSTIVFTEPGYVDDLQVEAPHPADVVGDWHFGLGDAVNYAVAYKQGNIWSIPPNPIQLFYAVNMAVIYKTGEYYDHEDGTAPNWWVVVDPDTGSVGKKGTSGEKPKTIEGAFATSTARSFGSGTYTAEVALAVSIDAVTDVSVFAYGAEEQPPAGWTNVVNVNESGNYDYVNHKVKWLFFDGTARTLEYDVIPPAGESGLKTFTGIANFGPGDVAIGGDSQIDSGATTTTTTTTTSTTTTSTTTTTAVFAIDGVSVTGDTFRIEWDPESGMSYKVWWTEDLSGWPSDQFEIITGGYWDETNFLDPRKFYRLTREPL